MNNSKLKEAIKQKSMSIIHFAKCLGMNPSTFYRKLNGVSGFTYSEMQSMRLVLGQEKVIEIFFAEEVAQTQLSNVRENV